MEIYKILLEILDKPDIPKFYRKLRSHYEKNGHSHEVSAFNYLIEKKFEQKDATPPDDSDVGQE